jgi:hypothetical protein
MYIGAAIFVFLLRMWKLSTTPDTISQPTGWNEDSKADATVSVQESRDRFSRKKWIKITKV